MRSARNWRQGDIEGARQLARELFNQMAQMVAAMQNAQRSAMASSMGRMQGEMQRQSSELQEIAREQQEILVKTEGLNNSALTERDAALKNKLDEFLKKAVAELGQLTELFPDREGPDDPSLLTNLDDATMNALLRNLIAKLSNKDFPGFGEGDGLTRKELAKKRTPAQEPRAQRARKEPGRHQIRAREADGRTGAGAHRRRQALAAGTGAPPGRAQRTHRGFAREA